MTTHSGSSAGCTRENITKTHSRHDIKYAFLHKIYTNIYIFFVFEKSLFWLLKLYLFDQKYSKNSIKVKYYYYLKSLFQFFSIFYVNIL